jgi:hypothetical protein
MSRIEEAFRRVARREVVESVSVQTSLERFAFEESPAPVHSPPIHVVTRRAEPVPVPQLQAPATLPAETPVSDEALVDFRQIGDYIGFVVRSVIRHPFLASIIFLVMMGLTVAAVVAWPRTYHLEARLLAQPDLIAAYSNPRPSGGSGGSPTYAISENILRHDNLVDLIQKTDLLNEWVRTRPPALRLKDRVFRALRGEPTEQDRIDAMVGLL